MWAAEACRENEMGADWTILPVLAVIFLATLVRSAFGFGEALVAVPLLALAHPGRGGGAAGHPRLDHRRRASSSPRTGTGFTSAVPGGW